MQFKATPEVVRKMCSLACQASKATGLGFLHFEPNTTFPPTMFVKEIVEGDVHIDYIQGRMVKLHIFRKGEDLWEIQDSSPRTDYQSWASTYPTYRDLLAAAEALPNG